MPPPGLGSRESKRERGRHMDKFGEARRREEN